MSGCRAIMVALGTPGLTHAEARVFAYYVGRANGARVCWPKVSETGAALGQTPARTVMAANRKLAALGLIRIQRRYKDTNNYFILDPEGRLYGEGPQPEWKAPWSDGADLQETAPQTAPDLQETAPQPDLQETAPQPVSGAESGALTCKIPHSDLQETVQESKTQERLKEDSSKRAAPPRVRVPDVVDDLFREGLPILIGLTGMAENRCRGILGRLRKAADDDCARVLDALHRACDVRPSDPFPWLLQAVQTREAPLGVIDTIRRDWNLPTFLGPDLDDEPATPERARIVA